MIATTRRVLLGVLVTFVCLLCAPTAEAYPWMIRHDYAGCGTCHMDPSGAGILTRYGRVIGDLVLRSRYAGELADDASLGEFLFGAVPLPPWLLAGGDSRVLWVGSKVEGVPITNRRIIMQSDLEAGIDAGAFIAAASLGYADQGALAASITRKPENNLVSRQHWVGVRIDDQSSLLVRAGRLQLPFGIRNVEHTFLTRAFTRTSINEDQQHGVAVAWSPERFRAELMAILGNFQLRPDDYRERGYTGTLEWMATDRLGVGLSSLVTHRDLDPTYLKETWRQSHGLFTRWATGFEPLVLLAEADYTVDSPKQDQWREGVVGFLQLDLEPIQGAHLILTGEAANVGIDSPPITYGAWFSYAWFLAPHVDFRIDNVYQSLGSDTGRIDSLSILFQTHIYL